MQIEGRTWEETVEQKLWKDWNVYESENIEDRS
jgi:hypothetical protein